jgi:hypothetical protein
MPETATHEIVINKPQPLSKVKFRPVTLQQDGTEMPANPGISALPQEC